MADLPGLNEREGLEQLVDRADAARQHDERIGVLDEQDLTNEEVVARDASIKIPVRPLLMRECDVAANGTAPRLAGAAIGRFHQAGPAAGQDGETDVGEPMSYETAQGIVRMVGTKPCGAEDGDAGAHEVEHSKAAKKVRNGAHEQDQLAESRMRTPEQDLIGACRSCRRNGCGRHRDYWAQRTCLTYARTLDVTTGVVGALSNACRMPGKR